MLPLKTPTGLEEKLEGDDLARSSSEAAPLVGKSFSAATNIFTQSLIGLMV